MTENEILQGDGIDIVKDKSLLRIPCEKTTKENGEEIASKLFRVLTDRGDGYGLAANQIGIQKRVCVINVRHPLYLINPEIVDASGELIYFESCLSFPDEVVRTKRFSSITIKCDNLDSELYLDVSDLPPNQRGLNNLDVMEIVAIQHEISHLDGKTMHDFEYRQEPIKIEASYGRNDKITITNGTETKIIKFKQFDSFKNHGYSIV